MAGNSSSGRTTELTEEISKRIVEMARLNIPLCHIASGIGKSYNCLYQWLRQGKKDAESEGEKGTIFGILYSDFKRAKSDHISEQVEGIVAAGRGGAVVERKTLPDGTVTEKLSQPAWQARAWLLERREDKAYALNAREIRELEKQMKEMSLRLAELLPHPVKVKGGSTS